MRLLRLLLVLAATQCARGTHALASAGEGVQRQQRQQSSGSSTAAGQRQQWEPSAAAAAAAAAKQHGAALQQLRGADVPSRPVGGQPQQITSKAATEQIQDVGQFYSLADLVTPYGYPLEEHFVTTADGYILRMFRIPHGRTPAPPTASSSPAPAVLLQHGLLDSAAEFLLLGPEKSLALLLADAGFDVWLPNSRGNVFSRNHSHLDLQSEEYWAFSFDEMAEYDLPAELEYVAQVTTQPQLSYVGFSQGSTIALAALSSRPDVARRINVAVLMAPVAFLTHITSVPLQVLAALNTDAVFQLLGVREFLPSQHIVQLLEGQLCFLQPSLCLNILAAISGFDGGHIDARKLPLYLQYTPAGASVQNMAHMAQCVRQPLPHTLSHFDWGLDCSSSRRPLGHCNQMEYGQDTPPVYHLESIKTPLMLLTGGHDRLADPLDVEYLREVLPAGLVQQEVHVEEYEHLDFVWVEDANERLYRPIINFLLAALPKRLGQDGRDRQQTGMFQE